MTVTGEGLVDERPWVIWGSELSPFTLKLIRLYRHARIPFRFLPEEGGLWENIRYAVRLERLKRGLLPLTWPQMSEEDEFPLVPFLCGPDGENLYDSTAIAHWLDRRLPLDRRTVPDDEAAAFIVRLIDDYADEFGLYMAHHNRWKISARDNNAGQRVAREFRSLSGPLQLVQAHWFSRRQTRRLPYLFSVAPDGFHIDGLPAGRQPPCRAGFPPTHELLEQAFERLLGILENLLSKRSFLLGGRFSLADASLYGQLGMNLSDPSADRWMQERAPHLHRWLVALHGVEPEPIPSQDQWGIDTELRPLLAEICRTYVPLMRQNAVAYRAFKSSGCMRFNEAAFDAGECLYDGKIDGHAFRSVAKSFQAKVWRECQDAWEHLSPSARENLETLLPVAHGIGADG